MDIAFHPFTPAPAPQKLPVRLNCPFCYRPHPMAVRAAAAVQAYLAGQTAWQEELGRGKMFGVLVVEKDGHTGFLAAYSGLLAGRNDHPYFVPPVFDLLRPDGRFKQEERKISGINRHVEALEHGNLAHALDARLAALRQARDEELSAARQALKAAKAVRDELRAAAIPGIEAQLTRESQFLKAEYKRMERKWQADEEDLLRRQRLLDERVKALKAERRQRSEALQEWLFAQFRMLDAHGEEKDLWQIFREAGRSAPPSGAGECAAPKLLQHAYRQGYRPLAMAEFWWGASPEHDVRRHGHFYPACKTKCEPILHHMLRGLDVAPNPQEDRRHSPQEPEIVYEDEWMIAVNKPAGMLSVPGKSDAPSVAGWARERYPHAEGPLLVHRLDMDTSGLLLIAKTGEAYRALQRMFEAREIRKRYVAVLDGTVQADKGFVRLPLCPNPDDRPRQMVSREYRKPSVTRFEVLARQDGQTRVALYPLTGRTHQLRVHAAHAEGLDAPIVGDNLYGRPAQRLLLHAESLSFRHFKTGKPVHITVPPPF